MYNITKTIDLRAKKVSLTDITKLEKRIQGYYKLSLTADDLEAFEALLYNFEKGNFKKANDIANSLDCNLNNECIRKVTELTVIK